MCNLDTVRCERGGNAAFLLERRRCAVVEAGGVRGERNARDEDETERRPRAIWSRKLAMYAVSLHNCKLSVDGEGERAREREKRRNGIRERNEVESEKGAVGKERHRGVALRSESDEQKEEKEKKVAASAVVK